MTLKPVTWLGSSRGVVQAFPTLARSEVGHELYLVQQGLTPSDWKPMSSVGPGVMEIRIHAVQEFRVIYVARFEEAVYVLHAFEKRDRHTRIFDVELARRRLSEMKHLRQGG